MELSKDDESEWVYKGRWRCGKALVYGVFVAESKESANGKMELVSYKVINDDKR